MKNRIAPVIFLSAIIILLLIFRNFLIAGFVIPVLLGAVKLVQILDGLPRLFWWTLVIILSLSLFMVKMPPRQRTERFGKKIGSRGRLDYMENLIRESDRGSSYSGRQLALVLINIHRRNRGIPPIAFREVEDELSKGALPESIESFVRLQFAGQKKNKKDGVSRKALERAVEYLKDTAGGIEK